MPAAFMNLPENTNNPKGLASKTQSVINLQIFFAHFGNLVSPKAEEVYMTIVPVRYHPSIVR